LIREATGKLLDSIAKIQRFQGTGRGDPVKFRAVLLELRRGLMSYQAELKGILAIQSDLSNGASNELIGVLSKAESVCDNIALLTEMNPNSDPEALVARLCEDGGLYNVERLLKAYFPR
jgi:hypothetical protein